MQFRWCQLSHSLIKFLLDLIFHFGVYYVISFQNTNLCRPSSGVTAPDEGSIPPTLTSFPVFIVTYAHLLIPNSMAISFERILTVFSLLFGILIKLQIIDEKKVNDLFVVTPSKFASCSYFLKGMTQGD